jgi:FKBP-type peptidyl-prolyl cis-trans isomerase FkpA
VIPNRFFSAALVAAAAVAGSACYGSQAAPAANAPFSQSDLRVGAGILATTGTTLVVNYTGWLYAADKPDQKGLQFETSVGLTPLEFTLGAGNVIKGWDQGLVGMKVGGLRRLVIPPSLAYGGIRQGPIPPNTSLVFEVELLEVKEPEPAADAIRKS